MGLSVVIMGRRVEMGRTVVPIGDRGGDVVGQRPGADFDHDTSSHYRITAHRNTSQESRIS